MRSNSSFKHMENSPILASYAKNLIDDTLEDYTEDPAWSDMVFSLRNNKKTFKCRIYNGDGMSFYAKYSSSNMQRSIDKTIKNIASQLVKYQKNKEYRKDLSSAYLSALAEQYNNLPSDDKEIPYEMLFAGRPFTYESKNQRSSTPLYPELRA